MSKISRRDSLRYITLAGLSSGLLMHCQPGERGGEANAGAHEHINPEGLYGLSEEDMKLLEQEFFTEAERKTVRVLGNLIIPADERSGNAEEAGCVEFIEFMMLDQPDYQVPMRGGLKWLDMECLHRFNKSFVDCSETEQKSLLDDIAYPDTAPPELSQGVAFFNLFRDFVATGFWTSKMGIEDLQYMGNKPTVWNGPPQEWVEHLGVENMIQDS
jgi:gluconate 2-dehydrogenase gamma chain